MSLLRCLMTEIDLGPGAKDRLLSDKDGDPHIPKT